MIQPESLLGVVDNSKVKTIKCVKVLGGFKKRYGVLGNLIRASIQGVRYKKQAIKKGDLVLALIVQTRFPFKRKDGQKIQFLKNSAILLDTSQKPLASRCTIPFCKEFRQKKSIKLLSLASTVL